MSAPRRGRSPAAAAVLALLAAGCSKGRLPVLGPDQRPTVEITQAPAVSTQPFFYAYEIRWAGFDMDGNVDHFLYCVDPPTRANADTPWVSTTANRTTVLFRSDATDTLGAIAATGYHTFVLKAVDDRGLDSAPVWRSFTSFTVAPTVQILDPVPHALLQPLLPPSFRVTWTGSDPDGRTTSRPVKYKFAVFYAGSPLFPFGELLSDPDSLRRYFAPGFAGWDSVGGDTTWADVRDLIPDPNRLYKFIVIAIDEAGAYSPVLNPEINVLNFYVGFAGALGPQLTIFNSSFFYQYASGGFNTDPSTYIRTEAPANRPVTFNWSASLTSGGFITGYRWMLDGDVNDETPRTDEATDYKHWSQYSPLTTTVTFPPFALPPGQLTQTHVFFLEAKDNNDLLSLGAVQFTLVKPAFDRDLLFVNDTRLAPDHLISGLIDRPRGVWPTYAELDTFFFAHGGFPWRSYPAGTLSPTGVFQGYSFDTVGTRFVAGGIVPLEQLGHYRHVVWMVDGRAVANNFDGPTDPRDPMPSLEWISNPARSNDLGTWVTQGGKLWLLGGGAASALQHFWEKAGTASNVYSNADGELVPGRFMYDLVHWRSEITSGSISQGAPPPRPPGGWPGAPDYSRLPGYLFEKNPTDDPIDVYAPNRTNPSDYFQTGFTGEALTKDNVVTDTDPVTGAPLAALDTLYMTAGGGLGSSIRPFMTYYHGQESQPLVFSGFPLWYWSRPQQIAVIDWVLQDVWGLTRTNVPR